MEAGELILDGYTFVISRINSNYSDRIHYLVSSNIRYIYNCSACVDIINK